MIRKTALAIAAALPLPLLLPTVPAAAMTPRNVLMPADGWNRLEPPSNMTLFTASAAYVVYSVSCGGVTATGWSADSADDPIGDWDTAMVTTSQVVRACSDPAVTPAVIQADDTFVGRPHEYDMTSGAGTMDLIGEQWYADWDFVPSPRPQQWVGVAARSQDGTLLPLLERRIGTVGDDTFAVDSSISADYIGAPVFDNVGRTLGMVTAAGTVVTGAPKFCARLFICADPTRVWWDIDAPSVVRAVKPVAGKGFVTVTWRPVASNGGDSDVAYWYLVGNGDWKRSETFRATVKAKKGAKVTVTVVAINQAGPGPQTTVSAKAK